MSYVVPNIRAELFTQAEQDERELRGMAQTGSSGFGYVAWGSLPDVHQHLDDGYYGYFPPAPPAPPCYDTKRQLGYVRKKKPKYQRKTERPPQPAPVEIVCAICGDTSYKRPRHGDPSRIYRLCAECATEWNGKLIPYEAEQKLLGRRL